LVCNILVVAGKNDVITPTNVITIKAFGENSNKGEFDYDNILFYFKTSHSNRYVFCVF
jgi:hypothetical protein